MSQQQTVLRVQTNIPSEVTVTGTTSLSITPSITGLTYSGAGTSDNPYVGSFGLGGTFFEFGVQGEGVLYYNISMYNVSIGGNFLQAFIRHAGEPYYKEIFTTFSENNNSYFTVQNGDSVAFKQSGFSLTPGTFEVYFSPDQSLVNYTVNQFDFLDLYDDIPITINKSFAELQDIAKRNSDYSIGLKLPGSKKNNRFFESFFNVDTQSLYFDVTNKVQCQVLINDTAYFSGYLKLNSVSVQNSKVEYNITLYSNIGDLFGSIGNNLLKDLDFRDNDYHFNHVFTRDNVLQDWRYETLKSDKEVPSNFFYPVMHNGYNYETSGNTSQVLYTGLTGTSLYTTTKLGSWANNTAAYAAGVQRYRINSPQDGVRDNQLKPALNIYSLIQLMFKTYGYKIKSDFMTSPWAKLLYMYGYFSNDTSKFSYKTPQAQVYGLDGVEVIWKDDLIAETHYDCSTSYPYTAHNWTLYVVKKGTGTPVFCNQDIVMNWYFESQPCYGGSTNYSQSVSIPAGTTGATFSYVQEQWVDCGYGCPYSPEYIYNYGYITGESNVSLSTKSLSYLPLPANTVVDIVDGVYVDFGLIIDPLIKQIDVLGSIAKKFNLVFVPDPEDPTQIIVEPYQYYVGTGNVYDWTDKLSWDKGFTVQPAQNIIESEIIMTDLEDGDTGNTEFKNANSRIYGQLNQPNPTQFKAQTKKIETTFSPQLMRQWNPNNNPVFAPNDVGIPLGINYTESSQEVSGAATTIIDWIYKGVKTKPKLFYNMGNFSPFLDDPTEVFGLTGTTTAYFRVSDNTGANASGGLISPVVSHTMPMGNPDNNKINNDSICILFNSEQPSNIAGGSISLFNAYTAQDTYNLFYEDRVNNAFDKNTRILDGFFELKLNDVQQLTPKDIIKIKEQYFTWNKIENFNLTNRELTKVELVQTNYAPSTYPTRYFQYSYCSDPTTLYKFKTEFVGTDSIYQSLFYWSVLYDYFCGTLGATDVVSISGYTSSFKVGNASVPYSIHETTESVYNSTGISYESDPLRYFFLLQIEDEPVSTIYNQNNTVWLINSGQTQGTLNVFTDCADFATTAASLGVITSGTTTGSTYNTGVTINVTDTGYIKYNTPEYPDGTYQNLTSLGSTVLPGCVDCESLRIAVPFFDLASWTVISCGTACP
jgi:hypothetical protein